MADPLLYLGDGEVQRFLPDPARAVALVDGALRGIAEGRALLRHDMIRPAADIGFSAIYGAIRGERPLAAQKWVAETPDGVAATLLLNDGATGALECVMDARALTGLRTAAVSGACVRALAEPGPVALIGTGLQCRWHLRVLDALGWREARIAYRRAESAEAVRAWAAAEVPGMGLSLTASIAEAVRDVPTVISMVTRGAAGTAIDPAWLARDVLLLPVDFAHCVTGDLASAAALCAADDPGNYAHARAAGELPAYPEAVIATGALLGDKQAGGRIVIQNMGNAACDLAIAAAVVDAARAAGAGLCLDGRRS